jgi:hypothetical protein
MTLIGYVLWLALAVYVGKRVTRAVKRSRRAKLTAGWGVGVLLALLPFGDIVLGMPVTIDACRKRGGLQIHENVSRPLTSVVQSIESGQLSVCAHCSEILIRRLASEIQVDVPAAAGVLADPNQLVLKPGPTRYWLSQRGDPHCERFFTNYAPSENVRRRIWALAGVPYDDNACIAAESIPEITADYSMTLERGREERHGFVRLEIREVTLTRRSDESRIASLARISQMAWVGMLGEGADPTVPICPSSWKLSRDFSFIELFNRLTRASSTGDRT